MTKKIIISSLLLAVTAAFATERSEQLSEGYSNLTVHSAEGSFELPLFTSDGVSYVTSGTSNLSLSAFKIVEAAKEDAATFVASEGAVKGAALQKALEVIRAESPSLKASDLEIAQEILNM